MNEIPIRFPRLRLITWFDTNKETDWRVNSSTAALSGLQSCGNVTPVSGSGRDWRPDTSSSDTSQHARGADGDTDQYASAPSPTQTSTSVSATKTSTPVPPTATQTSTPVSVPPSAGTRRFRPHPRSGVVLDVPGSGLIHFFHTMNVQRRPIAGTRLDRAKCSMSTASSIFGPIMPSS